MDLRQDLAQRQQQTQKIAPNLIHANLLLQCSSAELQQIIEREQSENPALDGDEQSGPDRGCAQCPGLGSAACRTCAALSQSASSDWLRKDDSLEEPPGLRGASARDSDDDSPEPLEDFGQSRLHTSRDQEPGRDTAFDPILLAAAETSLADHLLSQMRGLALSRIENRIAEFLVGSLDPDGYLRIGTDEIGLALGIPDEQVNASIRRLQSCDPPGIGARDVQECLLIQLAHFRDEPDETEYSPVAEIIIRDHWRRLVTHRHQEIRDLLCISEEALNQVLTYIRSCLTPRPGAQFRQPWSNRPDAESMAVVPDVVIVRTSTGFDVEIAGFENFALNVNPYYRNLYDTLQSAPAGAHMGRDMRLTTEHIRHVVVCVERANLFLKNLARRRNTIERITRALIDCQLGYISTGKRGFIRPLTRAQLGLMVNLHESTVSRALQHKYVQIPIGDVVPFVIFFGSVASAQEMIARIIAEENPSAPLSDQAIAEELKGYGITIARRTVVKYREDLRIPASFLRRPR